MKKTLLSLPLLFSGIVRAAGYPGSDSELIYFYATMAGVILLIVGVDKAMKYVFRKMKEDSDERYRQTGVEHPES